MLRFLQMALGLAVCLLQVHGEFCRMWGGSRLQQEVFVRHACANCYQMMPDMAFISRKQKLWYDNSTGYLVDLSTNATFDLPKFDLSEGVVRLGFRRKSYFQMWLDCCTAAEKCCQEMMHDGKQDQTDDTACSTVWDGYHCWPEVLAGRSVENRCPKYLGFYVVEAPSPCPRFVTRECLPSGQWRSSDAAGMTNYDSCLPLEFSRQLQLKRESTSKTKCCRTERRVGLSYESFRLDTCARCYVYIPQLLIRQRFIYNPADATLRDPVTNICYYADYENESNPIYDSFRSKVGVEKWRSCCRAAEECCHLMNNDERSTSTSSEECEETWDGWQCFPRTLPGQTSFVTCADHVYFREEKPTCEKYAEKYCTTSGKWYYDEHRKKERTSYRLCGNADELKRQMLFHITMYAVSVSFLMPALMIFFAYKQLDVFRISMHKQFFFSLLLNGIATIALKSLMFYKSDENDYFYGIPIIDENGHGCKFLSVLTMYFRMTNYMWMFCEGFYLHKLISAGFVEQKNLLMYHFIGWIFPLLPTSIYGILRKVFVDDRCWVFPAEHIEWICNGPNLIGLVTNLVFLCDIIRVLITKLRASHASEPSQYRKAVRATLVLVPLFGLHFLFILYRPLNGDCSFMITYKYFSHMLDGLQGFLVSLIFCYFNGEVTYLLKRSYQRWMLSSFHGKLNYEGGSSSRRCMEKPV